MHLKKAFFIINILCWSYSESLSQTILQGSWHGQKQIFSCWAASLSNLTRGNNNKTINVIQEDYFYRGHKWIIQPDQFDKFIRIADSTFNFRSVSKDSVLSFSAIQRCFSYRFSRPIIYSFGYEDGQNGHFVNIYGTTLAETDNLYHQKWLNIFDPKPNETGSRYYKNYMTYSIVDNVQYSLQSTHYQFVANRFSLPSEIPDAKQKSIQSSELQDNNCITNTNLTENIRAIIQSPTFVEIVGSNITFPYESIPVSRLEYQQASKTVSPSGTTDSQFITVESASNSFLIIPLSNGVIKSGVVVDQVSPNCFLIDRIENLTSFRGIEAYLSAAIRREIFTIEQNYRFLYYQKTEQSPVMIIDLDGFFGNILEKLMVKEFFQKLLGKPSIMEVEDISLPIVQPFPPGTKRGFKIKNPQ